MTSSSSTRIFVKERKGFTLLELLVVIAIIGVLSSITVISLSRARSKARDVKRLSDMEQLERVLLVFQSDHESDFPTDFPHSGHEVCAAYGETDDPDTCVYASSSAWIPELIPTYARTLPVDPKGFPEYEPYKYLRSEKYGYVISFKLEVGPQQDECRLLGANPGHSTRCGRMPTS